MGRIHNIEGKKNKMDSLRSNVFTKHARAITVAARAGGGNPDYNAALKLAIQKAKADNMPNDNINRAIKKGTGEDGGANYEQITYEEERLLITALDVDINTIERTVHALDGIFIPAHIDKSRFSILSQLGFVPKDLKCEALELSPHTTREQFLQQNAYLSGYKFIRSSDAHYIDDIGKVFTIFSLPDLSFDSIRTAITR